MALARLTHQDSRAGAGPCKYPRLLTLVHVGALSRSYSEMGSQIAFVARLSAFRHPSMRHTVTPRLATRIDPISFRLSRCDVQS